MGLSDGNRFLGSKVRAASIITPVFNEPISLAEVGTPLTPAAGYIKVYAKADGRLYMLDSTGKESLLEVPMNTIGTVIIDASLLAFDAWYEVFAVIPSTVRRIQVYDTSGNPLQWAVTAVPATPKFITGAGTNETIDVEIPVTGKLHVKCSEAAPYVGQIVVNLIG